MLLGFEKAGIEIEEIAFCPHAPEEDCSCRKPSPRLVKHLAHKYAVNLKKSYFVGDKISDVKTGHNSGCRTILIRQKEKITSDDAECEPDLIVKDLLQAVKWIIK